MPLFVQKAMHNMQDDVTPGDKLCTFARTFFYDSFVIVRKKNATYVCSRLKAKTKQHGFVNFIGKKSES
jgi:hypothetical protein